MYIFGSIPEIDPQNDKIIYNTGIAIGRGELI